jgi:hypothetical protein
MRVLLALAVAALVVGGFWVFGGKVTDEFVLSMILTAVWVGAVGLACLVLAVRRRRLALPLLAGFLVPAVAVGGYLGATTLRDKVVNERVVAVGPASGNSEIATGAFESHAHPTTGEAALVRVAEGGHVLVLRELDTSAGPDLRVYLAPADGSDVSDHVDLGGLKGNIGTQQYEVPAGTDLARYSAVVVWCRAFSVNFGTAVLREAR